jgi:hypothetical protein
MFRAFVAGLALLAPPIVGGQDADQSYDFMVSVQQDDGEHLCGGSYGRGVSWGLRWPANRE